MFHFHFLAALLNFLTYYPLATETLFLKTIAWNLSKSLKLALLALAAYFYAKVVYESLFSKSNF